VQISTLSDVVEESFYSVVNDAKTVHLPFFSHTTSPYPIYSSQYMDSCGVAIVTYSLNDRVAGLTHNNNQYSPEIYLPELISDLKDISSAPLIAVIVGGDKIVFDHCLDVLEVLGIPVKATYLDDWYNPDTECASKALLVVPSLAVPGMDGPEVYVKSDLVGIIQLL
jgi:hypothetical protein